MLFKPRKEIRLERLSSSRGAEIADSSPQNKRSGASVSSQVSLVKPNPKKPTPKPNKEQKC